MNKCSFVASSDDQKFEFDDRHGADVELQAKDEVSPLTTTRTYDIPVDASEPLSMLPKMCEIYRNCNFDNHNRTVR